MVGWLIRSAGFNPDDSCTRTDYLRYFGPQNEVVFNEKREWRNASWSTIHACLLQVFGLDRYHTDACVVGVDSRNDSATLRFLNRPDVQSDLVVFADGIQSVGRSCLARAVRSRYAGYLGWRGTVPEGELSAQTRHLLGDAMSYCVLPNSHIVLYPIPGPDGSIEPGQRLLNFVWYRNVEDGAALDELLTDKRGRRCSVSVGMGDVQERYIQELREAAEQELPPVAAEVVTKTAQPYIQVIQDVAVDRMAYGRSVLVGDAAFALRPHAAAGTSKAVADAVTLVESLARTGLDVEAALASWEPQQLELGRNLARRVREMGTRSQFEGSWVPGDPAFEFGLYGPGR
jgi:2,6-dihydroxypyridine 3-monooxygenase